MHKKFGLTCVLVDPWFNFRATKYLVQHGFYKFWDWFDDRKHSIPDTPSNSFYEPRAARMYKWVKIYKKQS